MQLGFVIDQTQCIGCHACSVVCKSENLVPVDSFRTRVKYTEAGQFPSVKRSFSVLRCNQCTDAPCMTICPVNALAKRSDGIVDVDPAACIGCKSCMQGCPYDALYINPDTGTAQKCHFCVHRTEQGLAPACAVVCPTEAIIPGDFHDPDSVVSRMKREFELTARKPEAGTGPNVFYRDASPAGIDPELTSAANGSIWSDRHPEAQLEALQFDALAKAEEARTTYDVTVAPLWGSKISGYLFTKSLAAGTFLAGTALLRDGGDHAWGTLVPLIALVFLAITSLLLVTDLKRPERFLYILTRPNWDSWLVRGTWALMGMGGLLTVWLAYGLFGSSPGRGLWLVLVLATGFAAALSACYTGWLFGQAKGRVLWMKRGLWLHLIVQAFLAGSALLSCLAPFVATNDVNRNHLSDLFLFSLVAHFLFVLIEEKLAPRGREKEYHRTALLISRGPFSRRHWTVGVLAGIIIPIVLVILPVPFFVPVAAILALVGLWVEEEILVRAGQALPIS